MALGNIQTSNMSAEDKAKLVTLIDEELARRKADPSIEPTSRGTEKGTFFGGLTGQGGGGLPARFGSGLRSAVKAIPHIVKDKVPPDADASNEYEELLKREQIKNLVDPSRIAAQKKLDAARQREADAMAGVDTVDRVDVGRETIIPKGTEEPVDVAQKYREPDMRGEMKFAEGDRNVATDIGKDVEKEVAPAPDEQAPAKYEDVYVWKTDEFGNQYRAKETKVNSDYAKYLAQKEFRSKEEDKILIEAQKEKEENLRIADSVKALMQNQVAVWKAAAIEKKQKNIPKGFVAKHTGGVAETFALEGLPHTKAYQGQVIETAMGLSKIITGGSRVIRSVINKLIETLPKDDMLLEDMEAKISQSLFNTYARAIGRDITKDERQELQLMVREILDTPPSTVLEPGQLQAPEYKWLRVNGADYKIPIEDVARVMLEEVDDDDVIEDVSAEYEGE